MLRTPGVPHLSPLSTSQPHSSLLLHGGDLYTPNTVVRDGALLVRGGRIAAVGPASDVAPPQSSDVERIDARGGIIVPGFIDLQINGAAGILFTDEPTEEALDAMTAVLPQFGCTSLLPTLLSCSEETTHLALAAAAKACSRPPSGAQVLGVHMEGPFLHPDRVGAHDRTHLRLPSTADLKRWLQSSDGALRLLTLAPELPGAPEVIREAVRGGVAVAVGHTAATYEQTAEAADLGATMVTHLFNATGGLSAREPGTAGAALSLATLAAGIIADGVHLHPATVRTVVRAKGAERVALVTDAMPPVGATAQEFSLLGRRVTVRDGACRLDDGTLAGSVLTMDQALRNVVEWTGLPLQDALGMATLLPARIIGADAFKGSLDVDKDADIVVLDRDLRVLLTIVGGRVVYHAPDFPAEHQQ